MARKKYACDFETTTDPNDCRVWGWGYMEIGNTKNYKIGNNLDDFMEWLKGCDGDIYFHNLRFDGSFIVNWLFRNGFEFSKEGKPNTFSATISSMLQWYMLDICYGYKQYKKRKKIHVTMYDSAKKLPFKIKDIAKDFNLPLLKGEIDYHKYRPVGHVIDEEEKEYIHNDLYIMAEALKIQFEQGLTKMTIGSDSMSDYKDIISKQQFERLFPVLDREKVDDDIRRAYRGGFTWLNEKYANKMIDGGIVFDVNSLYPAQMYDRPLPYGVPKFFEGEYEENEEYPLYIQHLKCEFRLKDERIPIIQLKNNPMFRGNEYLKSSGGEVVEMYVTNVDWKLIQEHYHLYDVEFIDGFMFRSMTGLFKQYIDKWTYIKVTKEGSEKLLAKLMLNNLYGKFATNPDVTGKVPELSDDGVLKFDLPRNEDGEIIEEFRDPVYTAMGVFITSWARFTTIETAQKCYDRIIYCDTDSIHLTGTSIPESIEDIIDDDKLGYWSWEGTFKRAKYVRQKTYMYELYMKEEEGKLKRATEEDYTTTVVDVKCAGLPDEAKRYATWDNFTYYNEDMLMPARDGMFYGVLKAKQVAGGVVLTDSDYKIKKEG